MLGTFGNLERRFEIGSIGKTAIYCSSVTLPRNRLSQGDLGSQILDFGFSGTVGRPIWDFRFWIQNPKP
jgi:hypothetical protein